MEDFQRRYASEETDQFPSEFNRSSPGRYSDHSLKRRSLNQTSSASRFRRSATLGPEARARRRQTWDGAGSNLAAFLFANDLKASSKGVYNMGVLATIFDAVILMSSYLEYVVIFAMGAYISYFLAYFFSTAKAVRDQAATETPRDHEQGGRAITSEEQRGAEGGGTTRRRRHRRSGKKMGNKNGTESKPPVESVSLHGMSDTSPREHDPENVDDALAINTDIIPSKDDGNQANLEKTRTTLQDSSYKPDHKGAECLSSEFEDIAGQAEERGVPPETADPKRSFPGMAEGETAVGNDGGAGDKGDSAGGNSGVHNAADQVCTDRRSVINSELSASASSEDNAMQEFSKGISQSQSLGSASRQADTGQALKGKPRGGRRKGRRQRTNNKSAIGVSHAKNNTIIDATGKKGATSDCKQLGRKGSVEGLSSVGIENLEQPGVNDSSTSCINSDKISADSSAKVYDVNNSEGRPDNGEVRGLPASAEFGSRKTGETDVTDSAREPADVKGQKLNAPKLSADPVISVEARPQGSASMETLKAVAEAASYDDGADDLRPKRGTEDPGKDAGGDTRLVRLSRMKSEDKRRTREYTGCVQGVCENGGVNNDQTRVDGSDALSCDNGEKRTRDQATVEVSFQDVSLELSCKDVDSEKSEGTKFPVTTLEGDTERKGGRDSGCDVDVGDADVTVAPGESDADAESGEGRCASADNDTVGCPKLPPTVSHNTNDDKVFGNVSETVNSRFSCLEVGSSSATATNDEQGRPNRDSGVDFGLDNSHIDGSDVAASPEEIENKAFKISQDTTADRPTLSPNEAGSEDTESLTKNSRWVLRNTFLTMRSRRNNIKTKQTAGPESVSPNTETEEDASTASVSNTDSVEQPQNSTSDAKTTVATSSKVTARKIKLTLDQALCPPQLSSDTNVHVDVSDIDKDSQNSRDNIEKSTDGKEIETVQLLNVENKCVDQKEVESDNSDSGESPADESIARDGADQTLEAEEKNTDEKVLENCSVEPNESITAESRTQNDTDKILNVEVENSSTEEKVFENDKAESSNGTEQLSNAESSNAKEKLGENVAIGTKDGTRTDDNATTCVGNVENSSTEEEVLESDKAESGTLAESRDDTEQIFNAENRNAEEKLGENAVPRTDDDAAKCVENLVTGRKDGTRTDDKAPTCVENVVTGRKDGTRTDDKAPTCVENVVTGRKDGTRTDDNAATCVENVVTGRKDGTRTDDNAATCVGNVSRSPVEPSRSVVDPTPGGAIRQFTQRNSRSLSALASDNRAFAQLPISFPGTSGYWSDPGAECGTASPLEFSSVDHPAPFLDDTFAGMMPLYPRGQQRQPADSLRRRSLRSSTSVEAALRYYDAPERSRTPPPHSMYKPSAYYRRSMIDLREGYVPPSTRTEARRRETRPKEVVKTEVKSAEIKRETPVLKQVLLASTTPPLRRRSAEDLSKEKEKLAAKIAAKQEPSVTTREMQEKIHATKVIVEDVEPAEVVEKPAEQPAEVTEIEIEPPRSDIKDTPPSPPPPTVVQPSQKPDTIPTDTTTPPPPPKIEEKTATIEQEQQRETTTTKDAAEPETKEEAKELPRRSVVYTVLHYHYTGNVITILPKNLVEFQYSVACNDSWHRCVLHNSIQHLLAP
uniref:Uncharacterized protein n=1 Tax=Branchiostoma floridae TaxID=7739 RepID=C3Y4D5_BRAFL|eukprot:XP_002608799.1 hypothetical protein BRAFLDRAFT_89665 [Branchiostoma floridae]